MKLLKIALIFFLSVMICAVHVSSVYAGAVCTATTAINGNTITVNATLTKTGNSSLTDFFPLKLWVMRGGSNDVVQTRSVPANTCQITVAPQVSCAFSATDSFTNFGINLDASTPYHFSVTGNGDTYATAPEPSCSTAEFFPPQQLVCGQAYPIGTSGSCSCNGGANPTIPGSGNFCCGWLDSTNAAGGNDYCAPSNVTCSNNFTPGGACTSPCVVTGLSCTTGSGYTSYICQNSVWVPVQTSACPVPTAQTACSDNFVPGGICTGPCVVNWLSCSEGSGYTSYTCQNSVWVPVQTSACPVPTDGGTPGDGVTRQTFMNFNKAIFGSSGPATDLTTPRGIISRLLPYLFTFGGLILFVMILWGGFEMLTGAANPKSQEAGRQRITTAIIGFVLLFSSYWIAQIVQAIFGISILN